MPSGRGNSKRTPLPIEVSAELLTLLIESLDGRHLHFGILRLERQLHRREHRQVGRRVDGSDLGEIGAPVEGSLNGLISADQALRVVELDGDPACGALLDVLSPALHRFRLVGALP